MSKQFPRVEVLENKKLKSQEAHEILNKFANIAKKILSLLSDFFWGLFGPVRDAYSLS